jgi:hypothetical protein
MFTISTRNKYFPFQVFVFSAIVIFISFILQGNIVGNVYNLLRDEGFLWYGAQRVMLGEIPIRDFMSYDPGRYYWSAALMSLWGDNGIIALRGAVAAFQTIGLFTGLLLIAQSVKSQNLFYLLLSATTIVTWMFPHFRLFDISLSILLIGILTFLVRNPTARRYFFAGIGVGLVAVFGRNHGVYGIAGSIGVMFWLNIKRMEGPELVKGLALWSAGVTVGFMPILFMALLVPGFAVAFWESIMFLFESKSTNLPLAVPWPWQVDFATLSLLKAIRAVLIGLLFIAIIVFAILSIIWVVSQKLRNKQVSPAFVATSFLALPYVHYTYSRADISTLPLSIFPLLVGCLVILATQPTKVKWTLAIMLCAISISVTYKHFPAYNCRAARQCVNIKISGSNMVVDPVTANEVRLIRRLAEQYARDGRSFVAAPFWPGAYPLLEQKSPTRETYGLFPRSSSFELAEIKRIQAANPGFVLVSNFPQDGQDFLRFKNTHPLTYRYILDNFEKIPASSDHDYQIFRAKKNL